MNCKLILSNQMELFFENLKTNKPEVLKIWKNEFKTSDYKEILHKVITNLNNNSQKMTILNYEFSEDCSLYGQSNTFFGFLANEKNDVVAYFFMIPPDYSTRSGVLAQQVFPVISGIMPYLKKSADLHLVNRPIYVVNLNEQNLTASISLNILCGKVLGFYYYDLYERDIFLPLQKYEMTSDITSIASLDRIIKNISKGDNCKNDFFEIDSHNKILKYKKTRLKDGIKITNEPYWFVLKAYAAAYLGKAEGYTLDMSEFSQLPRGNKTLDSFRDYLEKLFK